MNSNTKNTYKYLKIKVYLAIITIFSAYLVVYIDSNHYFNIKKISFSFNKNIKLFQFDETVNNILIDNAFNANLQINNEQPYLLIKGFKKELLSNENSIILKNNTLHPSQSLSLFSMGYASDYLMENYKNGTLGQKEVDILEKVYLFVFQEIINPFSTNYNCINDHAISERIQFVALFSSFVKDHYPEKKILLNNLSRDFNICLGFLMDDNFFTWQTNHGIMQLRSLIQVSEIITNKALKESIVRIFDKRLIGIIPYYIGQDGAVYEAASGYWVYIYKQFSKIAQIKSIAHLKSITVLKATLIKSNNFINTIASNDNYLQGMGDSYSAYIYDTLNYRDNIRENRYFQFSNGIIGGNWSSGKKNYNVMFVSLDNPPNIHKLPEDLAVYLYINQSVFSNTGTYSYNNSNERLAIENEKSQSTVSFKNSFFKSSTRSKLSINEYQPDENFLSATGKKYYEDNDSIMRRVNINANHFVTIKDWTLSLKTMIAFYNVDPKINIKKIDNKNILLLTSDSTKLLFSSNCNITISNGKISMHKEEISDIKRLELTGNPIEVSISFPEIKLKSPMQMNSKISDLNIRSYHAKKLEKEYKNSIYNLRIRELIIKKSFHILFYIFVFILFFELIFIVFTNRQI